MTIFFPSMWCICKINQTTEGNERYEETHKFLREPSSVETLLV